MVRNSQPVQMGLHIFVFTQEKEREVGYVGRSRKIKEQFEEGQEYNQNIL